MLLVFFAASFFVFVPARVTRSDGNNILTISKFNEIGDLNDVEIEETPLYISVSFSNWDTSRFNVNSLDGGNYCAIAKSDDKNHLLHTNDPINLEEGIYRVKFSAAISGRFKYFIFLEKNSIKTYYTENTIAGDGTFHDVFYDFKLSEQGNYVFYLTVYDNTDYLYVDDIELLTFCSDEKTDENLITENGACIRTNPDMSGLLFKGRVNKSFYDDCASLHTGVKVGMIIAPTDFLNDCPFTYSALFSAKSVLLCVASKWNNSETADTNGYYGFSCAIVKILPYNTDREFSARSFISYTENGETKFIYADYDQAYHSRSVYGVAKAALNSAATLNEGQLSAVNYFYNIVEKPTPTSASSDGNTFTLNFSSLKGYFVLDYDRTAYDVIVTAFTVKTSNKLGDFNSASGMYKITSERDVSITFTVTDKNGVAVYDCPVSVKIYNN